MGERTPSFNPAAAPALPDGPVLIVGLGKSGAATLRYCRRHGIPVALTDTRAVPPELDALRALAPDAPWQLGGFAAPEPWSQYALAVVSPGVPLDDPFIDGLRAAGVEIVGDIEIFARAARAPVLGITGSNGKSTVTTLVGEMLQAGGMRAAVGGNLGTPALDLLSAEAQAYVLELSSFQLETTEHLQLAAATMLNISPDHLDRHGSLARYIAAKARIYAHARIAVVNRDDPATHSGAHCAGRIVSFGLDAPAPGHYGLVERRDGPWLAYGDDALLPCSALKIQGLHNVANALAALALAHAGGVAHATAAEALRHFKGLRHRCEWVAAQDEVIWLNDSKGTNVGATLAALQGLPGPLIWLGGGQGKGQDFTALAAPLAAKARLAILFGADAERIAADLGHAVPVLRVADLDTAVAQARAQAQAGDRVLLSPACASLDQFKNYEARGQRYCELIAQFAGAQA